jgi:hypothetical protein
MKFYITGIRRGLGQALANKYGNCDSLEDCDVFINCKHDGFSQVEWLQRAASLNKRIINIGSNAADWFCANHDYWIYSVEKMALDNANEVLFYRGVNTTVVRFGYFDSPRVEHIVAEKMTIEYCVGVIDWIINQPHRVKEITITP